MRSATEPHVFTHPLGENVAIVRLVVKAGMATYRLCRHKIEEVAQADIGLLGQLRLEGTGEAVAQIDGKT